MRKRWVRASLAIGIVGATLFATGTAASASTVTANDDSAATTMGNAVAVNVVANDTYDTGASNITVDAGGTITLPGLSKTVTNLTLYYEKAGFGARISRREPSPPDYPLIPCPPG